MIVSGSGKVLVGVMHFIGNWMYLLQITKLPLSTHYYSIRIPFQYSAEYTKTFLDLQCTTRVPLMS